MRSLNRMGKLEGPNNNRVTRGFRAGAPQRAALSGLELAETGFEPLRKHAQFLTAGRGCSHRVGGSFGFGQDDFDPLAHGRCGAGLVFCAFGCLPYDLVHLLDGSLQGAL